MYNMYAIFMYIYIIYSMFFLCLFFLYTYISKWLSCSLFMFLLVDRAAEFVSLFPAQSMYSNYPNTILVLCAESCSQMTISQRDPIVLGIFSAFPFRDYK